MSAEDRIKLIEGSVQSFRRSWLSLISFVRIVFAVSCAVIRRRVRRSAWTDWNPAGHLMAWGGWMARLGVVLSLAEWLALAVFWARNP